MLSTWIKGPLGPGAEQRRTRHNLRPVLVMVPHLVAGTRLMDLVPLLESDHRIQTIFTVPENLVSWYGTGDFVRAQGGLVLPWHQVLNNEFSLVLAASHRDIHEVRGPVMTLPHGATALKSRLRSRETGDTALPVHGLAREELVRNGRVVPSALMLTHDTELDALRLSCPEAVSAAVVGGDLCLDRMRASLPHREQYRAALGVSPDDTLVVVHSTWSGESVFGQHLGLYRQLLDELPSNRYRMAAVLHPNIWAVHGRRQVRAWLSDCTRKGLMLLAPEEGWQAATIAADVLLGDHGSTTQYGAAIGIPTVLATYPDGYTRSGSPADILSQITCRLLPDKPIAVQILKAMRETRISTAKVMTELLTSRPEKAATIFRNTMYRLLDLSEPSRVGLVAPVPLPRILQNDF
jgi:hypothetical protein